MKRVRQESAEFYEITATEIALALGLFVEEGVEVTLTPIYNDKFKLKIAGHTTEDVEIEAPVHDPVGQAYMDSFLAGVAASALLSGDAIYTEIPLAPDIS